MRALFTALVMSSGAAVVALASVALMTDARPAVAQTAAADPATRGATLFRQRCGSCHTVNPGARSGIGPNLAGTFGRPAGGVAGYNYSPGLKRANLTWNRAGLDSYLAAPRTAAPGTRMAIAVANPQDRAAIIAYLETATRP